MSNNEAPCIFCVSKLKLLARKDERIAELEAENERMKALFKDARYFLACVTAEDLDKAGVKIPDSLRRHLKDPTA